MRIFVIKIAWLLPVITEFFLNLVGCLKRYLLICTFWCTLPGLTLCQSYSISLNAVYGSYDMSDLRKFQNEIYEDVSSDLSVPFRMLDEFPGYLGYELHFGVDLSKFQYGVQAAYRSTGGKISYSDYSGKYNIENHLNSIEFSAFAGIKPYEANKISILLTGSAGISLTNHTLSSIFQITNTPVQDEEVEFSSINAVLAPGAKIQYLLHKNLFIDFSLRYDIHIQGKLNLKENDQAFLTDREGNPITANWSGLRAGIGVGVKF